MNCAIHPSAHAPPRSAAHAHAGGRWIVRPFGSGTTEQYLAELEKRQRLEVSYRENAERRFGELLSKPKDAYVYWLRTNAQLKAMGIYELPLPEVLRGYQAGLYLDE